jgi:cytidylate kinase
METNSDPITPSPEDLLDTSQPKVVVCGLTASGKSTFATRLAKIADLEHLPGPPGGEHVRGTSDEVRQADLALLDRLVDRDRPTIVESAALPYLLPVHNTALIVRLTASTPVRAHRLQTRTSSSHAEARHQVELTDATMCARLRSTWGIDIADSRANRWRADLVLGCPHLRECPTEETCRDIVTVLLAGAYHVYENYVTSAPAADSSDATAQFNHLRRTFPAHLRRYRPALIERSTEFSAAEWRHRMLGEVNRRAGLL